MESPKGLAMEDSSVIKKKKEIYYYYYYYYFKILCCTFLTFTYLSYFPWTISFDIPDEGYKRGAW